MKSDDALAAEQALEAKLAEAGADKVRRHTFDEQPATTAEEEAPAATEEPPPAEPETPAAEEASAPVENAAVAAYLKKYNGDVNKALEAAVSAQRKLGELGNELGEHRQQAAEYEQVISKLEQLEGRLNQPPQQPVVDQATVDWLDEQITLNPAAAPQYAAQALQAGQHMLYERIMETWFAVQPRAASQFDTAVRIEQVKQELAAQTPARDENVVMQAALQQVLAEHPEFHQYADDLASTIERYPAAAAGLKGSQQEKQQAIETLFALAERDTLRSLALSGNTPAESTSATDVATATTSQDHPDQAPAEPTPLEKWREDFRETADQMRGGAFVVR